MISCSLTSLVCMSWMVSWAKLISQPHHTRQSWNCAFFQEIGAAMAQKNTATRAEHFWCLGTEQCAQKIVHKQEGFMWLPREQAVNLAQQEGACTLPPVGRKSPAKMALHSDIVCLGRPCSSFVGGLEVNAGPHEGSWCVTRLGGQC